MPEESKTTDENPVLQVGGVFQWRNLPKAAKWVALAIVAAIPVTLPAILSARQSYILSKAETEAKVAALKKETVQAKNSSEAGYQFTKDYAEKVEKRLATLEEAYAKEHKKVQHRSMPLPQRPAPLPKDLNTAEKRVNQNAPSAPPKQPDAGVHDS